MNRQVDIKKGTAVATAAFLFLLVAVTVNADRSFEFADVGDDMKSAVGNCYWSADIYVNYYVLIEKSNSDSKGRDNCMNACKNDPECKYWLYTELKEEYGGQFWRCKGIKEPYNYEAIDSYPYWDAEKSGCGYIPSRAS